MCATLGPWKIDGWIDELFVRCIDASEQIRGGFFYLSVYTLNLLGFGGCGGVHSGNHLPSRVLMKGGRKERGKEKGRREKGRREKEEKDCGRKKCGSEKERGREKERGGRRNVLERRNTEKRRNTEE